MTQMTLRIIFRWIHIILGLVLLCYVYSPFGKIESFQFFIKFLVVPVIVLSGIGIWKPKIVNRLLKIK